MDLNYAFMIYFHEINNFILSFKVNKHVGILTNYIISTVKYTSDMRLRQYEVSIR